MATEDLGGTEAHENRGTDAPDATQRVASRTKSHTHGTDKVDAFVAGLRAIADWYEQHPEIDTPQTNLYVYGFSSPETPELVAQTARALGTFKKTYATDLFKLTKDFGGASLEFVFYRNAVCTKRVVKTETVTELVPDPAAPKIEVTREREIVEWDCPPLLGREVTEAA